MSQSAENSSTSTITTQSNGTSKHHQDKSDASSETESLMAMNENQSLLPHLESFDRMMKLPVVEAAWNQSQDVYGKVKGSNAMFNWAFNTAEDALRGAIHITAPFVQKFDRPIHLVDQTLVRGIDKLEVKAPIIKEPPQEIYNQAKSKVIERVQPHLNKVCSLRSAGQQKAASLKELSWAKANEVLATQYGSMAVSGVDTTATLAERLLDYYFPRAESDVEDDNAPIAATEDPVLHTVQTVGRLSNKIARRVYRTVSRQVKQLKKEDVHEYVASLIAVLRLTQYLNFINEKMTSIQNAASTSKASNGQQKMIKDKE
ncbi:lipid storage droplets surface-binding protein 2 [Phlebotomus argentipes]|uniref:lipid storage droplets surface-binding protein 2 n=1 Tax=Phlebotomus argentipes TaxID=94469 RepID=UPI002892EC28|nr:lipid storage droplets surface-binding protein 2 [Phlebotomus argentipes]